MPVIVSELFLLSSHIYIKAPPPANVLGKGPGQNWPNDTRYGERRTHHTSPHGALMQRYDCGEDCKGASEEPRGAKACNSSTGDKAMR